MEDENSGESHFTWIKSFNRLVSNYDNSHSKCCLFCLSPFKRRGEERRIEHMKLCQKEQICKVICPKDMNVSYTQYHYQVKSPITLYADFESVLKPVDDPGMYYKT